jgi:hypothetical protein
MKWGSRAVLSETAFNKRVFQFQASIAAALVNQAPSTHDPELTKLENCSMSAIKGKGRIFV